MNATVNSSDGKVSKIESALPFCRDKDSLWNRNVVFLLFSAISAMRLPISCTSCMAWWPYEPAVLIAAGKKMCVASSSWYFVVLLSATCLAAAPQWTDVELRCDSAQVSGTVTSHAINFPLANGINVAPSGRLPSRLRRPAGFLCSFNVSPYDVIHLTVSLLSGSTSAAG